MNLRYRKIQFKQLKKITVKKFAQAKAKFVGAVLLDLKKAYGTMEKN